MLELQADSQARYERFIRRVVDSGEVWVLQTDDEGWCITGSNDDEEVDVMPFWSDRAYAGQCAREEWAEYTPTMIELDEFLETWLPTIARDGLLAGTNWNVHLVGREVDPLELKTAVEAVRQSGR